MKIEKIAENNVRVTRVKKLKSANTNRDVEVLDEDNAVEYGISKAESELASVIAQKEIFQDEEKRNKVIADLEVKEAEINEIINKLNE